MVQTIPPPAKGQKRSSYIAKDGSSLDVRPTLIVGLGGTGCRALQWFNEVVRRIFGVVPPFIKMLGIDSDVMDDAPGVKKPFPRSDFYNVFDEIHIGAIIKDWNHHPDFHPTLTMLENLNLPSAIVERGCQGVSRLGRLVFFHTAEKVIRPAVIERFESLTDRKLREQVEQLPPVGHYRLTKGVPVVHVISSVCGGTGSGMLLDMAYALQEWGRESFGSDPEMFGHLVLPEAFRIENRTVVDKLRAVAHSILQQVEFFMDHRRKDVRVDYPGGVSRQFNKDNAPFDACYVINGHSDDGGSSRDELTELIARMVLSLTIEPSGREVYSELSNMHNLVLSTKDKLTKRLMCFQSYGLGYGTVQNPKNDVRMRSVMRQWLLEALRKSTQHQFDNRDRQGQVAQSVDAILKEKLSPNKVREQEWPRETTTNDSQPVGGYPPLERAFELPKFTRSAQPARGGVSPAWNVFIEAVKAHYKNLEGDVQKIVEEKYNRRLGDVERSLRDLIRGEQEQLAAGRVCRDTVERRLQELNAQQFLSADAVFDNFTKNEILKKIYEAKTKPPVRTFEQIATSSPMELKQIAQLAIQNSYPRIVHSLLRKWEIETLQRLLEKSLRPLTKGLEYLEGAIRTQEQESLDLFDGKGANNGAPSNGSAAGAHQWESIDNSSSPFAIPLFEMLHPDKLAEKEDKTPSEMLHSLAVRIVAEFLARYVRLPPSETSGRVANRLLHEVMNTSKDQIKDWMESYDDCMQRAKFRPADPNDISSHPLFPAMQGICSRLVSKIAINRNSRYTSSQRKLIAQFPDDSCMPALLQAIVGNDFRSALVHKEYADRTATYLQLMNFSIGFCLPALDNLDDYRQSQERYLQSNVFEPSALWLDPSWPQLYRNFLDRVEEDARRDQRKEEEQRQTTEKQASDTQKHLGEFEELLQPFFGGLRQDCEGFSQFDAQRDSQETHTRIELCKAGCLDEIVRIEKLPRGELNYLPTLSDPILDRIESYLWRNFLLVRVPLFEATVRWRLEKLRRDYGDLLIRYEAGRAATAE